MPKARTASSATDDSTELEKLPCFDGTQLQVARWLRELRTLHHLLDPDLAYFVTTGAANASQGKTAVLSLKHALLLQSGLLDEQDFSIVKFPPPIEDKFEDLYAETGVDVPEDD